jgi:hypothetical protein
VGTLCAAESPPSSQRSALEQPDSKVTIRNAVSGIPMLSGHREFNHEIVPVHAIYAVSQILPLEHQTPFTDFSPALQYNKFNNLLFLLVFLLIAYA